QPLGRRGDATLLADSLRDRAIGVQQHRLVVIQPHAERRAAHGLWGDLLGNGEARRMFRETLDAEELFPQHVLAVPGRNAGQAAEGPDDRDGDWSRQNGSFQEGLNLAGVVVRVPPVASRTW